jgi:L,D-transpeptidase catalytic domain/Putative peptidoglycan binding domain
MRRVALVALAALVTAPSVRAATCTPSLSQTLGASPLTVTYGVVCDVPVSAHWTFGDGGTADSTSTQHVYRAGRWRQAVDVTDAGGNVTHVDLAPAVAYAVALRAPRRATYGDAILLRGRVTPALSGRVTIGGIRARWTAPGVFRLRARASKPGPYVARFRDASSAPVWVVLRPKLDVHVVGTPTVGAAVGVAAKLNPAAAGTIRVRVDGRTTRTVDTHSAHDAHVVVIVVPRKGWTAPHRTLAVPVVQPNLGVGARGPTVRMLEQRLRELHYALRGIDGVFGDDDYEAVLAFEKVTGLSRTGTVDAGIWRRLFTADVPRARYGGTHIEVDKTRQVLFFVRGDDVQLVVHVSTGATGNTPLGLWHVYSKVPGWNGVLWYPNFFLRGFAIHGYPEVPAYPASHGCVRIPMWIAPILYSEIPSGFPIYVYA